MGCVFVGAVALSWELVSGGAGVVLGSSTMFASGEYLFVAIVEGQQLEAAKFTVSPGTQ